MEAASGEPWDHDHTFGQDRPKAGERRTIVVIAVSAVTMVGEIAAGVVFGSMALLADGLHMGSHAAALTISALGYFYTRRHARDPRFNFGAGKINSLAAFASATLLVVFALVMVWESSARFVFPVPIEFNHAILVAVLGLVVNGVCLTILGEAQHEHEHDAGHEHGPTATRFGHDHNLWSAYLHVAADAMTSVLAILALLAGKYLGQAWLDPLMGIVGAVLVVRWSWGLLHGAGRVLLDMRTSESLRSAIREAFEREGNVRVADLHLWTVGPGIHAVSLVVVAEVPRPPAYYKQLLPRQAGLVHVTVEVWPRPISSPEGTDGRDA